MAIVREAPPRFRVNENVRFPFGIRTFSGKIVQDRGPIGARGRRLYQVRFYRDTDEPELIELPEADLEPDPQPKRLNPASDKPRIIDFFKRGGLRLVLKAGEQGGPPHFVGLGLDQLGNITHSFVAERSEVPIGGAPVPVLALHDSHVFTPKVPEVVEFLERFGLTPDEANEIIQAMGTRP